MIQDTPTPLLPGVPTNRVCFHVHNDDEPAVDHDGEPLEAESALAHSDERHASFVLLRSGAFGTAESMHLNHL